MEERGIMSIAQADGMCGGVTFVESAWVDAHTALPDKVFVSESAATSTGDSMSMRLAPAPPTLRAFEPKFGVEERTRQE